MAEDNIRQTIVDSISFLNTFKIDISQWFYDHGQSTIGESELRSRINKNIPRARRLVHDTGNSQVAVLAPPPMVGGIMIKNADPFGFIVNDWYGRTLIPMVSDMIDTTIGVLESPEFLAASVEHAAMPEPELELMAKGLHKIMHICRRSPLVARQIQARHNNRSTLSINDEYDVQDLFHALLKIDFDDIRAEEWTPSYAGKSARMDFLLKRETIVIEIKKTRENLGAKEVGDQLIIDIERYKAHPNCKCLVCFVYDPEYRIGNPTGIERDLTKIDEQMDVRVIVSPNNY